MSEEFLYAVCRFSRDPRNLDLSLLDLETIPSVLRVLFEQVGIRGQISKSDCIASFKDDLHGCPRNLYINSRGTVSQFPDSFVVQVSGDSVPPSFR